MIDWQVLTSGFNLRRSNAEWIVGASQPPCRFGGLATKRPPFR